MRLFKARNLTVEATQNSGDDEGDWIVTLGTGKLIILTDDELRALFEPIMSASIYQ